MKKLFNVAMIAVVVIFQPEMRKALENLGRKNILVNLFNFDFNKVENGKFSDKTITELVKACYEMGKVKTGALIVVEDEIVLTEYERTGIAVDGLHNLTLWRKNNLGRETLNGILVILVFDNLLSAASSFLPFDSAVFLILDKVSSEGICNFFLSYRM